MKRARVARALLAALALAACGKTAPTTLPPLGQLVVHIDTDAPLPAAAGDTLGPNDPPGLFDRLRIDVYRPGETTPCADCTHEFDIDRTIFKSGRASIGITPPIGTFGYVVRARLFRSAFVELGEPRKDATLDTFASLPPIHAEGITDVTVLLATDDVARPVGSLESPAPATIGRPPPGGHAGTWRGAQRTPCKGAAQPGEVCVPGGAYWMGNPLTRLIDSPGDDVVLRLVAISPFFLDATEVTVDVFRASGLAEAGDPMPYDAKDGEPGPRIHCTYRPDPDDSDVLPVNCVSWSKAMAYCAARGATLPSEAQFQYAAGGLAGHVYIWGDDPPTCDDAVYARASDLFSPETKCPGSWVETPGQGKRDRLVLPGGTIVDLGANLVEHALDVWNLSTESCWGTGVFHDPVCANASADSHAHGSHTVVGGGFTGPGGLVAASSRHPTIPFPDVTKSGPAGGVAAPTIAGTGFRCARPGQ